MKVKAAPGLKIRDPQLRDFLPEEGRDVPENHPYWAARLRDKDVVSVEAAKAIPVEATKTKAGKPAIDSDRRS